MDYAKNQALRASAPIYICASFAQFLFVTGKH
jgi:hypothetical protein